VLGGRRFRQKVTAAVSPERQLRWSAIAAAVAMATVADVTGIPSILLRSWYCLPADRSSVSCQKFYAAGLALAEKELQKNLRDSVTKAHLAYLRTSGPGKPRRTRVDAGSPLCIGFHGSCLVRFGGLS